MQCHVSVFHIISVRWSVAVLIQHVAKPNVLTEPLWNLAELHRAVLRLKMHKCGHDVGLTAEVLKHVPVEFWD